MHSRGTLTALELARSRHSIVRDLALRTQGLQLGFQVVSEEVEREEELDEAAGGAPPVDCVGGGLSVYGWLGGEGPEAEDGREGGEGVFDQGGFGGECASFRPGESRGLRDGEVRDEEGGDFCFGCRGAPKLEGLRWGHVERCRGHVNSDFTQVRRACHSQVIE